MKTIVVASTCENAGKTSIIVGMAKNLQKEFGYIKPFGDRLLYLKKRLWDYDAALMVEVFGLNADPENITVGFDPARLHSMYEPEDLTKIVREIADVSGTGKDVLFVEASRDMIAGTYINLDAISVARALSAEVLMIADGSGPEHLLDDLTFLTNRIAADDVKVCGVIINKVVDPADFRNTYLVEVEAAGLRVLGIVPEEKGLTSLTVKQMAERFLAHVIAGEAGLNRRIEHSVVASMHAAGLSERPHFRKARKLVIASGDRSKMLRTILDSDTSCVILTNDMSPSADIIEKANEQQIPLLLVPWDTYTTAMQVNSLDPLLTSGDIEKIEILRQLVGEQIEPFL